MPPSSTDDALQLHLALDRVRSSSGTDDQMTPGDETSDTVAVPPIRRSHWRDSNRVTDQSDGLDDKKTRRANDTYGYRKKKKCAHTVVDFINDSRLNFLCDVTDAEWTTVSSRMATARAFGSS
jgi:hypothetical protein